MINLETVYDSERLSLALRVTRPEAYHNLNTVAQLKDCISSHINVHCSTENLPITAIHHAVPILISSDEPRPRPLCKDEAFWQKHPRSFAMFPAPAFCVPVGLRVSCENPSSFAQTQPLSMAAGGSQSPRRRRPPRPTKQTSQFERSVDDLVGKRMGRGYIYYGERTGGRAGEEADAAAAEAAAAAAEAGEESDDGFLKDDAIVVAGGCGRTGQWITLGLVNQGFNVRVLTRVFERAEKLFGPSGSNGMVSVCIASCLPQWAPIASQFRSLPDQKLTYAGLVLFYFLLSHLDCIALHCVAHSRCF